MVFLLHTWQPSVAHATSMHTAGEGSSGLQSHCKKPQRVPSTPHLALETSETANTDASHKRILGLLCGQLGKAQVCPTLCHHPHNAGDLGKVLEVGCAGARGHFLQAFITAALLYQRKRVKSGSFLYSEKCTK